MSGKITIYKHLKVKLNSTIGFKPVTFQNSLFNKIPSKKLKITKEQKQMKLKYFYL